MADYVVSRIQNRRGLQVHLPQPLRPGELGLCQDTQKLFIGCEPTLMAPGVQVFPDYYSIAQSILDNQLIQVTVTAPDFSFEDFVAFMIEDVDAPQVTDIEENQMYYTNGDDYAYVGISSSQLANLAAILTRIDAADDVTSSALMTSMTIDANGAIPFAEHEQANAVAYLLNQLGSSPVSDGVATSKLNIEVITEYSTPASDIILEYALTSTAGWEDLALVETLATDADSFFIEYTISYDDGIDTLNEVGKMTIIASISEEDANLTRDLNEIRTAGLVTDIEFQAIYVTGDDLVKLQYQNPYSETATFRAKLTKWKS